MHAIDITEITLRMHRDGWTSTSSRIHDMTAQLHYPRWNHRSTTKYRLVQISNKPNVSATQQDILYRVCIPRCPLLPLRHSSVLQIQFLQWLNLLTCSQVRQSHSIWPVRTVRWYSVGWMSQHSRRIIHSGSRIKWHACGISCNYHRSHLPSNINTTKTIKNICQPNANMLHRAA